MRLRRSGETNPVTVVVVLLLAAAGFYGFHVGPVYIGNLEAKEAATEAFNNYWNDGEAIAKTRLLARLNNPNQSTTHYELDENGVESIQPGFGLTPENVTFINDTTAGKLTVRIEYERIIQFSPLKKRKKFHVVAEKIGTRLK